MSNQNQPGQQSKLVNVFVVIVAIIIIGLVIRYLPEILRDASKMS